MMVPEDLPELKVILVGDSGVGKTSLINVFIGEDFNENEVPTATGSFVVKDIEVENQKYSLNIWDTAGQEKYKHLTKLFYKGSSIVIFVFDVTNLLSFDNLQAWIDEVESIIDTNDYSFGIVGNKTDKIMNEQIKEEKVAEFAEKNGVMYKLVSAKSNPKGFTDLLKKLIQKRAPSRTTFRIDKDNNKPTKNQKNCNC